MFWRPNCTSRAPNASTNVQSVFYRKQASSHLAQNTQNLLFSSFRLKKAKAHIWRFHGFHQVFLRRNTPFLPIGLCFWVFNEFRGVSGGFCEQIRGFAFLGFALGNRTRGLNRKKAVFHRIERQKRTKRQSKAVKTRFFTKDAANPAKHATFPFLT